MQFFIYPNYGLGIQFINNEYLNRKENKRFRIFPSVRFEYLLTLLKNSQFIIGNSSAGIREAPYYGIPIINIGTRQQNRTVHADIINVDYSNITMLNALKSNDSHKIQKIDSNFGTGNSIQLFVKAIENTDIWKINHQKQFRDL